MQKFYKDIIASVILGLFFIVFYFLSFNISLRAAGYPRSLIIVGFLLTFGLFLLVLFSKKERIIQLSKEVNTFFKPHIIRLFATIFTVIIYIILLPKYGFIISTILFTLVLMYILNSNYKLLYLLVAPIFTLVLYFVFGKLLKVWLP